MLLLASLLAAVTFPLAAQEIESLAGVRLNFDRPGTRELGMGSAGIAVAGANGAMTNPASIAGQGRSLSIEGGRRTMEGSYFGNEQLDTVGVDSSTRGIESAAVTMPWGGLTWSFTRDEPVDVDHSTVPAFTGASAGAFFICDGRVSASFCNSTPSEFNLPATFPIDAKLRLQRYGATAAWSSGPFAVGASLRRETLRQESAFTSAGVVATSGTAETIDDSALTWSGGATWAAGKRVRFGATYVSGASFAGERRFLDSGPQAIEFRTPASLGAGIAIEALPNLTIAADARRVEYSAMMHDRRALNPDQSVIGYSDVTEVHAGGEYRSGRLALRAGWWRDPAHALSIRNGIEPPTPLHYIAAIDDADEDHLTAGIGYGEKTRLEAAVDRSDRSTRVLFGVSTTF